MFQREPFLDSIRVIHHKILWIINSKRWKIEESYLFIQSGSHLL